MGEIPMKKMSSKEPTGSSDAGEVVDVQPTSNASSDDRREQGGGGGKRRRGHGSRGHRKGGGRGGNHGGTPIFMSAKIIGLEILPI